jgi:hypothetical protein
MSCATFVPFVLASCFAVAACGGSSAAGLPEPPHLDEVMPMESVLHVSWTEVTPCDMVMAERKDGQHSTFAAAFQVDGSKTSHMDGDASMNMTYTYRLQCMVGDAVSAYSNELGANPTVKNP